MGKRAADSSTDYSRRVAEVLDTYRVRAGLTHDQLLQAAGFSPSYYYTRRRGDAAYTTNDVDKMSQALRVARLTIWTAAEEALLPDNANWTVRVDGREFGRRLRFLLGLTEDDDAHLLAAEKLAGIDTTLNHEERVALLTSTGMLRIEISTIEAIADHFRINAEYLKDMTRPDHAAQVEAEIGFDRALVATGASGVRGRTLGGISPEALREITEAILSINDEDGH
ncbi:hypothetical protein HQQ81_20960 [Microbacteriaceae bacterium VKM Ac-2854]|nr:hypothetical protein [Microbacteriaceae bacterium VKM Ac-2854]